MLQFQNHFSPTLDLIVWVMRYHMRSMPFSFWMYVDHVFQLESLVYDIRRLCAHNFPFFDFFWIFDAHFKCWSKLQPSDFLYKESARRLGAIREKLILRSNWTRVGQGLYTHWRVDHGRPNGDFGSPTPICLSDTKWVFWHTKCGFWLLPVIVT